MKKTLKILMAIILFAVVLTIATSVNAGAPAAPSYDTLDKAVTGEKDETTPAVEKVSGIYKVNANVTIKAISGTETIEVADGVELTITEDVKVNGTMITFGTGTIKGKIIVNKGGTLYVAGGKADTYTIYGKVFAQAANAVSSTGTTVVALELKDEVENLPVADSKKSEYGFLIVDEDTLENNVTMEYKMTVPGTDAKVTKFESGEKYNLEVVAKYASYVLADDEVSVDVYQKADKEENCEYAAPVVTIAKDLDEGAEFLLTVEIGTNATKKVEKTIVEKVGVVKVEEPEQPEQPNQPADPSKPAEDGNKGDLDESPKTGDHIIPAATLLAVVVVANVVYFAKSKNN